MITFGYYFSLQITTSGDPIDLMLGSLEVEKLHILTGVNLSVEPQESDEETQDLSKDRITEPALSAVIVVYALTEGEPRGFPFDLSRVGDFCRCAVGNGETGTSDLFVE